MNEETIVKVEGLTKKYDNKAVVDNLSFEIKKGEILGLLGPNGAGKSTTMNMLCSLIKPNQGTIKMFGLDPNFHKIVRRKLMERIKVIIADDSSFVREGMKVILEIDDNFEVIGCTANGEEAIEIARQNKCDVCLMDIEMPVKDVIEATRVFTDENLGKVLILTTFDDYDLVEKAMKNGAKGYVPNCNFISCHCSAPHVEFAIPSSVKPNFRYIGMRSSKHVSTNALRPFFFSRSAYLRTISRASPCIRYSGNTSRPTSITFFPLAS